MTLRASSVPADMPPPLTASLTASANAAGAASGVQKLQEEYHFNPRLTRRGLAQGTELEYFTASPEFPLLALCYPSLRLVMAEQDLQYRDVYSGPA